MSATRTCTAVLLAGLLISLLSAGCDLGRLPPATPAPTTLPADIPAPVSAPKDTLVPTAAPTKTLVPLGAPTDTAVPASAPSVAPPRPTAAAATAEIRQWAASAEASSQYNDPDWGARQATGAPDTRECGDLITAWASGPSDTVEWLKVSFTTALRPTQVNIVQSYNPGQVVEVELLDAAGKAHTVYTGKPHAADKCPATLSIAVDDADYEAIAVKITVDQSAVQDWSEIDAVELVGWGTR